MPIFFQHIIDDDTRLGIWKIEEPESFFASNVPIQQEVHHPHKRLQHLAGRFLLRFLFPAFPHELIRIADTRKPFLENEEYHFSISHCGDFAAAIVSKSKRVGVDIEIPSEKVVRLKEKFLNANEMAWSGLSFDKLRTGSTFPSVSSGQAQLPTIDSRLPTLLWSAKESVFKWYGLGNVDFRKHIHLQKQQADSKTIECFFGKTDQQLRLNYRELDQLVLAWVVT